MSKTLEGMARAIYEWQPSMDYNDVLSLKSHDSTHLHKVHYEMMAKSALKWLADNVSDEMVEAYLATRDETIMSDVKDAISAALRAAAEET